MRLHQEQLAYQELAERLILLIADSDPDHIQLDRLEVTPAFYTLQDDVDMVARAYHDAAQLQVAALRRTQGQLLIGTCLGFGLGLILVGMILRLVLGHQRRLVDQAAVSSAPGPARPADRPAEPHAVHPADAGGAGRRRGGR
nr:hypothetical protein GCM10020092_048990 [Actinoplanes digitatis]